MTKLDKAAEKLVKIISKHIAKQPRWKRDRIFKQLEARRKEQLKWN